MINWKWDSCKRKKKLIVFSYQFLLVPLVWVHMHTHSVQCSLLGYKHCYHKTFQPDPVNVFFPHLWAILEYIFITVWTVFEINWST